MTLNLQRISLILSLAGSSLLFGAPPASTNNQGGPTVPKRNFTQAEIQQTLQSLGVTPATSGPISCYVSDSTGAVVTTISPSSYPAGPFYWMHYASAGVSSSTVSFMVLPAFTGSAMGAIRESFAPNSTTDIETPLAIPFWGGDLTSGTWIIVVANSSNQHAGCQVTVGP
jgi:hypothetical protein